MSKKNMIFMIIIVSLLVLLIIFGLFSFFNYKKELPLNNELPLVDIDDEDYLPDADLEYFDTYGQVIEYIDFNYLKEGDYSQFDYKDDKCWYFRSYTNRRFSYCGDGIKVNEIK